MSAFELGDQVDWFGKHGTIVGLTTEPSAIVQFPNRRLTVGLSNLTPIPAPRQVDLAEATARLELLARICDEAERFEHGAGRSTPQWIHDVRGTLELEWPTEFEDTL